MKIKYNMGTVRSLSRYPTIIGQERIEWGNIRGLRQVERSEKDNCQLLRGTQEICRDTIWVRNRYAKG
jgi:hypothetical protein